MLPLTRKTVLTIAFAAALAIFIGMGWLAYLNMATVRESDYWQNRSYLVIHELRDLLTELVDAETGQRGFIITGNDGYLTPYNDALSRITRTRGTLRKVTADNPSHQKRLDLLEPLIDQKLAQMAKVVEARRETGFNAASDMVMTHLGKNLMDGIRGLVAEAEAEETRLLQRRTAAKEADLARTLHALEAGGMIAFTILLMVFGLLNSENTQRSRAELELRSRNAELEKAGERERSQNWVKTGLNELNARLLGDRPLKEMAADAVRWLSEYLKVGVAALYLFDEESKTLGIVANYAFTRDRVVGRTIALGEGLAGEAAREKRAISLTDVPADYLVVSSALGEAPPRLVLAQPLLHGQRLVGVMELGTLGGFDELELDFLNQAAEVLAAAVTVNLTRQRVDELLLQSRAQGEELRVQQEELQQSNEELEERAELLEQQREQIQAKNREMEEAGREIVRRAKEVEEISRYRSQFLANMSHELRTPLNSLMILSGQLKDNKEGNLTAKQVEYATTINSAGGELLNLINDILDLSKVESGRLQFVYDEVSPAELCQELASSFRHLAEQKGVDFSTAVEEGVVEKIRLDRQRTLQVLKNLISNALKFTRNGSVALRVYQPKPEENPIGVAAVAFEVTDTGIGIAVDKQELIFQAFQQADGSVSRKYGGTGLGLSISRELARAMGGEVRVASEEGKGSVFTVYLPVAREAAPSTVAPTTPSAPRPQGSRPPQPPPPPLDDREGIYPGRPSILIIEDDLSFVKILMERVRERGFAAVVATEGRSGLELAERILPTAILLDVMLPNLDGWGVMQKLTDNLRTRHIPVYFITSLEERQKALSMGAIGYMTKPVSSDELDRAFSSIDDALARTTKRLLVVEDDKAQAAALVSLLEGRDISITLAETGEEAVKLLSAERVDCIVLDLGLADMSGFDLLEHIRNLEERRRIPVIIHTGRELSPDETQRLQRYAETIIIKGAKSPERLLNEVTLFLHVLENKLPPEKQRMIRTTLDTDTVFNGKKVLLVDDDMRNIFSLSTVLREKGMQVIEAENGKVALERLEEHPDVNLVLMDVMMPEMDGYEATRLIRNDQRFARLPIIALTAKAMKGDREAALKAGASDYITKPIDMERLLSLLRVWLYNQ